MSLIIKPVESTEPFCIDTKRFYVPFVTFSPCPTCENVRTTDLSKGQYLSYPEIGSPISVWFYCDECDAGWSERFVLGITATPV